MKQLCVNSSDAYKVYIRSACVYLALYLTHTLKESSCELLDVCVGDGKYRGRRPWDQDV